MTADGDYASACRHIAEQLRAIAQRSKDKPTRELLLRCASDYERMADQVFTIELPVSQPGGPKGATAAPP